MITTLLTRVAMSSQEELGPLAHALYRELGGHLVEKYWEVVQGKSGLASRVQDGHPQPQAADALEKDG